MNTLRISALAFGMMLSLHLAKASEPSVVDISTPSFRLEESYPAKVVVQVREAERLESVFDRLQLLSRNGALEFTFIDEEKKSLPLPPLFVPLGDGYVTHPWQSHLFSQTDNPKETVSWWREYVFVTIDIKDGVSNQPDRSQLKGHTVIVIARFDKTARWKDLVRNMQPLDTEKPLAFVLVQADP